MHIECHQPFYLNKKFIVTSLVALVLVSFFLVTYMVNFANADEKPIVRSLEHTASVAAVAPTNPFESLHLYARSAVVIDATTGSVLYNQNADATLPLASITKIAMALSVLDAMPQDETIELPYSIHDSENGDLLPAGTAWKVKNLLDYTLVVSSNDGAEELARAASPFVHKKYPDSPESNSTIWRMNEIAESIPAPTLKFLNASGLDISNTATGGVGSARDVAALALFATREYPQRFSASARREVHLFGSEGQVDAENTNDILSSIPGLALSKTGYTYAAGGNLVIVFRPDGVHEIVAVILGSTRSGRFSEMKKLIHASMIYLLNERES